MNRTIIVAISFLLAILPESSAQTASVSTNLVGYANLATLNLEAAYPFARHWTVNAGVKYNPFTFDLGVGREYARNRQQSYAAGVRFWPWHVLSGWWVAGNARYQEYNYGGVFDDRTEEGDRVGVSVGGGYSHMLGKHFNIEFGLGVWGGYDWFTVYSCPKCGQTEDAGQKFFFLPSDVIIALTYVF